MKALIIELEAFSFKIDNHEEAKEIINRLLTKNYIVLGILEMIYEMEFFNKKPAECIDNCRKTLEDNPFIQTLYFNADKKGDSMFYFDKHGNSELIIANNKYKNFKVPDVGIIEFMKNQFKINEISIIGDSETKQLSDNIKAKKIFETVEFINTSN